MIIEKKNKTLKENIDFISSSEPDLDFQAINREQEKIIDWLEKVKFDKQFIGGVNEEDVWKKIQELNEMYEAALRAERIRYDVLLEAERKKIESASQIDGTKESTDYEK